MNRTLQALVWTLGWSLIHLCWEAAAIAALYLLADLVLRNTSSQTRYLLAVATLCLMSLAFAGTFGYETLHNPVASALSLERSSPPHLQPVPSKTPSLLANPSAAPDWTTLLPWLDGIWVLGVVALSIRSLSGWLWLQRLRRSATEKAPGAVQLSFARACTALGVTRMPELRLSEIVPGPMTIGALRTLVLLPASALLALSPEQLEAIFAHELAHVRRADYLWNLLQTLAETLFFFHPAVWWLGGRIREQRELCCDDVATATCSDPLVYATALFRLEEQRAAGLNLAMALDGHPSSIPFRSRILRILGETAPPPQSAALRPLSLFAVCIGMLLLPLSPLPRLGAIAAERPPSRRMLAVARESAPTAKNHSPGPLHSPPSTQGAEEAQRPAAPHPGRSQAPRSSSEPPRNRGQMRAQGYEIDEGQYAVMQHAEVTPAYAREMARLVPGRPSVETLLALKEQSISGESLAAMRAGRLEPRNLQQLIPYRVLDITPEFVAGMRAAGFDAVPRGRLQALRALGVTPEDAKRMRLQYPDATVRDLIELCAHQGQRPGRDQGQGQGTGENLSALPDGHPHPPPPPPPLRGSRRPPGPWWASSGSGQPPGLRQADSGQPDDNPPHAPPAPR